MEMPTTAKEKRKRGPGVPFPKGWAGGPGRPKATPEQLEQKRLARIAHDRVIADVHRELQQMLGPAVDKLRALVDSDSEQVALAAAMRVVEYAAGKPVSRTELLAQVNSVNGHDAVRRPDIAQLRAAAQRLLTTTVDVAAVEVER